MFLKYHILIKTNIIISDIKNVVKKEIIKECYKERYDFVSTEFTKQKKDFLFRTTLILNI